MSGHITLTGLPEMYTAGPTVVHAILGSAKLCRQAVEDHHCMYGHPGKGQHRDLLKAGVVGGYTISDLDAFYDVACLICRVSKTTRELFQIVECKAAKPLAVVHIDLAGPTYPVPIKDKSSPTVAAAFKAAYLRMRIDLAPAGLATGLAVQSDNGSKFIGALFQKVCHMLGIAQCFTTPSTAQQNGTAKRGNRTIEEIISALLAEGGLLKQFWAEVFYYAMFLMNNRPYVPLGAETPYHKVNGGTHPFFHSCRDPIFDKHVWVAKIDPLTFGPKALEAIFLGVGWSHGQKAYQKKTASCTANNTNDSDGGASTAADGKQRFKDLYESEEEIALLPPKPRKKAPVITSKYLSRNRRQPPSKAYPGRAKPLQPPRSSLFRAAPRLAALLVFALVASIFKVPTAVNAYIPAVPVNDTSNLDGSEDLLHLAFYNGVFNTPISRQLWAEGFDDNGNYTNVSSIVPWTKFSKGVLIHFDEMLRNQPPTTVPWIAMISCDSNGTSPSENDDIFTITRDLGAQAALLYSTTSEGCQITQEYLTTYEKVLDVYATTSLQASRIIESQFVNVNVAAAAYNSSTLNNSAEVIQSLLDSNALSVIGNVPINTTSSVSGDGGSATSTVDPTAIAAETNPSVFDPDGDNEASETGAAVTPTMTMPSLFSDISSVSGIMRRQATTTESRATRTSIVASASSSSTSRLTENYLGAVMAAANLTVGGLYTASATPSPSSGGGGGNATSTSLAMIILYAITGVVTFLFLIVILSGAIRAARHPERYGPRPGAGAPGAAGEGGPQTRAGGLTRAILDTFPVVKFGGPPSERRDEEATQAAEPGGEDGRKKDDGGVEQVELAVLPSVGLAPATPRRRSSSLDSPIEVAGTREGARPRAESRASTGVESFHSADTTPLAHRHSVASLGGAAALAPISPTAARGDTTGLQLAAAQSPSHAAVEATLASAADAAEADLCPICFCEFEDGDELRVLPCDNRHRFHSACIDPFLLNVSRLCPLCRLDLATVARHIDDGAGGAASEGEGGDAHDGSERHEEERVIRHLRALLHRGNATGAPSELASGAEVIGDSADAGGEHAGADSGARLRSRFAQYIAARRGRTRRGSSFTFTFSPGAGGMADGRIGAPV
ncbi:hypothetical protein JCM3770_001814 [Rhodotorula araucariae]